MAVSLSLCFFMYGVLFLGAFASTLFKILGEKKVVEYQSGEQSVSDQAIAEGMMWFSLGQNP